MGTPWSQPLGIWPLSCFWSTHGAEKIFDDLEHSTPSPAVCIGRQPSDSTSCLSSCHWGPCSPLPLKLTSLQPPRSPCEPSPAFPASAPRGPARSPHLLWGHLFHLRVWGFNKKEEEPLLLRKENDKLQVSVQNRKGRSDLERAKLKPQKIILSCKPHSQAADKSYPWLLGLGMGRPNVPDWKVIGATIICPSSRDPGWGWELRNTHGCFRAAPWALPSHPSVSGQRFTRVRSRSGLNRSGKMKWYQKRSRCLQTQDHPTFEPKT